MTAKLSKDKMKGLVARREQVTVALSLDANSWIRKEAQARGWRLVHLWYWDYRLPEGIVPRGALVQELPDDKNVRKLVRQGIPVVRIGQLPHPDDNLVPAVLPDHAAGGVLAAEHFFERGFLHVGYFGNDPWSDRQVLFEGFRDRSEALGMTCHLCRFRPTKGERGHTRQERKQREFVDWLRQVPKPLGLLGSGAFHAAVNCGWAMDVGLSLPGDVAVMAPANNPDICESSMPRISAIDVDNEGIAHAACDLLERMMAGEKAPIQPIAVPPKGVVERESTNVLATPDRQVAAALRYMWDHLDEDMSIEDIAAEVKMSSRQLARRFRRALNRTFTEELRRKRLEEARHLLRTTDLPIADLVSMVGFRSTTYLHRRFHEAFGVTPAQYRRREGR